MYEYVPCSGFKENCPDFKLTVDHIAQAIQTGTSSIQILNTKSRINWIRSWQPCYKCAVWLKLWIFFSVSV